MLGLASLFISGLPGNHLEVVGGKGICALPFRSREDAEATFDLWVETLARWKDAQPTQLRDGTMRRASVAGYDLTLQRQRVEARIPLSLAAVQDLTLGFWNPMLWPAGVGRATTFGEHQHTLARLYSVFDDLAESESILFDRSDVVLDARTTLEPAFYLFHPGTWRWLAEIPGQYVEGVPEVIVEIVTPSTRPDDLIGTGKRARLLAEAGVHQCWLVDPGTQTLSVHELRGVHYATARTYHANDTFRPEFPAGLEIDVGSLFGGDTELSPVMLIGPGGAAGGQDPHGTEETVGIEHLLLVGHPLHRYEVWEDVAPCVVAFRDVRKAGACYERWVCEAAKLEGVAVPEIITATFETPHMRLWHDGPRVHADVHYPAALQREVLETFALAEAQMAAKR